MEQIRYNFATNVIRFEFPEEWDGALLSGLTLQIANVAGTELLAATSVTLYTATTLNGAVAQFASQIILQDAAADLAVGDKILIEGTTAREKHIIAGAASASDTYQLEQITDVAFDDLTPVHGLWGLYTLDTTTVADYPAGAELVLTWTPTGTGRPTKTQLQLAKSVVDLEGIATELLDIYPRVYDAFTDPVDKIPRMVKIAENELRIKLELSMIQWDRCPDQDILKPAMIRMLASLWAEGLEDENEFETTQINIKLAAALGDLKASVFWQDDNQDGIKDEDEVDTHMPIFLRSH